LLLGLEQQHLRYQSLPIFIMCTSAALVAIFCDPSTCSNIVMLTVCLPACLHPASQHPRRTASGTSPTCSRCCCASTGAQ
jgi:hypothetical protein